MSLTVRLTGFLGCEPEHRLTQPRTLQRSVPLHDDCVFVHAGRWNRDPHLDDDQTIEIESQATPRGYTVLSVATHCGRGRQRRTFWHRVIAWGSDRHHDTLRWCHKGDQVEITGRPTTFVTEDGRELVQIELQSCRILRAKPRDPMAHPRFGQLTRQIAG